MFNKQAILVVGGGIAGMSAAIAFRSAGAEVELIDLDPEWRVYGAGITITGPTLRAFKSLGILDEVVARGYTAEGLNVCDVDGVVRHQVATPRLDDGAVPGAGGILRPALHQILSARTLALGVKVTLGVTLEAIEHTDGAAEVRFSDGRTGSYALVVGADGLFSRVRELIFPQAPRPRFTGQACWRLMMERPPEIDRRHFYLGGPVKIGLNPVSPEEMYMFLLHPSEQKLRFDEGELHVHLARLMDGYGGILARIRAGLTERSRIVYRPLEGILVPRPWYRGRAVLIGDAAHATTPQLASGAGLAVEDALVLQWECCAAGDIGVGLERFMERRFERCRMVVENSLELGRLEVARAPVAVHTALLEQSLAALNLAI
ncbi:FAD-dependent oxidoreductase [Duganella hordei]|uniref:FAD-dependent oxidoreductase n=1 Tax=Duganella hordei TaxID=2865934 RepID=UPI00333E342D